MSVSLVLSQILFQIRYFDETSSIALDVPRWAALNLWTSPIVYLRSHLLKPEEVHY